MLRLFTRRYASAPPPLATKWFYATDVPATKPSWQEYKQSRPPSKFIPFSQYDDRRLEDAYRKNLSSLMVNEDLLFEVDLAKMHLAPVYWSGPTYEVRRGTWFHSNGMPLLNDLSKIIEDGYHRAKPYLYQKKESDLLSKDTIAKFNRLRSSSSPLLGDAIEVANEHDVVDLGNDKLLLYFNEKDAIIFPRDMNAFQLNVIRNFGPNGSLLSVQYIQRGYSESLNSSLVDSLPSNPIPGVTDIFQKEVRNIFNPVDTKKQGEAMARSADMKSVLEDDYEHTKGPTRPIDHLVLCVHGIGQILGHKYESVNFTHSINVLRNTMREVYDNNDAYKKLNDDRPSNNVQVLPISWRHRVDFHPKKALEAVDANGEKRLPALSLLTVDGVKPFRNILGDVVLDVLLYYEPLYVHQVFGAVVSELNRVYHLYKERNPDFNGKVHIMGHSLGSAIAFDILSDSVQFKVDTPIKTNDSNEGKQNSLTDFSLDFPVENLFCVGSPVGVFKLLEQRNIAARETLGDDFDPAQSTTILSPKCKNLYNIFHPCDPVGYRMEPLVSPQFAEFKPETVPFAVKGINTQFQELAGLGEEISGKLARALTWFKDDNTKPKYESTQEKIKSENALGDIVRSLAWSGDKKPKLEEPKKLTELQLPQLNKLTALNKSGRVDYNLPMGVFDFSLVSAISAHVSYFEDKDTAGFILREVLTSTDDNVKTKTVELYEK